MSATHSPQVMEAIKHAIEQQIGCTEALLAAMRSERGALLGGKLEELEQACADKLAAANKLQSLGAQLAQLQAAPRQIEALLLRAPDSASALARWRQLLGLAAACQQHNLENGALLDQRQMQLRRTRRALLGDQAAPTYGRGGDSGYDPGRRSLASA